MKGCKKCGVSNICNINIFKWKIEDWYRIINRCSSWKVPKRYYTYSNLLVL